jgi:regulator of protease activity HflC (stomatin/prohibitin superfamily)
MVMLRLAVIAGGIGMLAAAAALVAVDLYRSFVLGRDVPPRWGHAGRLAALACTLLLPALAIVVVPTGTAGVRVSQLYGTRPGTVYSGTHIVVSLVQHLEMFDLRDRIYATNPIETPRTTDSVLKVYSREGPGGRSQPDRAYQLDPQRLSYIQRTLPQPIQAEILPPVVANVLRQTISEYIVRDVFSAKREEVRCRAADAMTRQLAADGVLVKEVMLRDIALPPEYAKGLEGLLLVAQQNDRMGIEQADGGTLLLDDIGDMPAAMQAKLLRLLQEGELERVGGERQIVVNTRVIVATHHDLESLVRKGSFREDLYHRVFVFPLTVPALRERAGDVPLLAEHFLRLVAEQNGWKQRTFSPEALEEARRYGWPGNVRELRNVVERVLLLAAGDVDAATVRQVLPGRRTPAGAAGAPVGGGRGTTAERARSVVRS